MSKVEKRVDKKYKALERALSDIGYESLEEFVEVACTLAVLVQKDLPKANLMSESFALHCGHILNSMGHLEKLKQKAAVFEKENAKAPELKIDMTDVLSKVKK